MACVIKQKAAGNNPRETHCLGVSCYYYENKITNEKIMKTFKDLCARAVGVVELSGNQTSSPNREDRLQPV